MGPASLYGGIEGGGTKFVCAVGDGPDHVVEETRFPTTTPEETIRRACGFFRPYVEKGELKCLGLASFGPVDVKPDSPTYGYITTTPKPNWANTDILGQLKKELCIPMVMDMDVAAAAMGEFQWGASRGDDPSLYVTVGTGIGGGYIVNGRPLAGLVSLEMGHIRIPHDRALDPFGGACPYHGDCFEGLASGPAIEARMGRRAEALSDDDPFWDLEAQYIALALANYIFTFAPKRIVVGGGVLQKDFLFDRIRKKISAILNGYLKDPMLLDHLDEYIVRPGLGNRSGVLGAIALAILESN